MRASFTSRNDEAERSEGVKTGGKQGLQDWNPNAAHLRHEGNERSCLKMQRIHTHTGFSQSPAQSTLYCAC